MSAPQLERVVALACDVLNSASALLGSAQVFKSLTLQKFATFTAESFQILYCKKITFYSGSLEQRVVRARAVWLGKRNWRLGHHETSEMPRCIPAQLAGSTLYLLQSVGEDRVQQISLTSRPISIIVSQ